jgi:hypothetical protein
MNELSNDILKILENNSSEPMSIHDIVVALPKYEIYNIKTELWDLAANGLIKFGLDWKITKSNDGPATF